MLLNDGLETIGEKCFAESEFKMVSIPNSVRRIGRHAFRISALTQVRFLGTTGSGPHCGLKPCSERSSSDTKDSHLESKHRLVIGAEAFSYCMLLR